MANLKWPGESPHSAGELKNDIITLFFPISYLTVQTIVKVIL